MKNLRIQSKLLLLSAFLLAFAGFALSSQPASAISSSELAKPFFTDKEKELIFDYFDLQRQGSEEKSKKKGKGKKQKGMPPGLAKKKELPPGLQKQLEKNGKLPPGLEKRELPNDLLRKLPTRLEDFKRVIVDNDVLLIEKGTEIILDILRGAAGR